MRTFKMGDESIEFRKATISDLPQIVALLADDPLGVSRESTNPDDLKIYQETFQEIDQDPNHELLIADASGIILGVAQITYLLHLTRKGARRAQGRRGPSENRVSGPRIGQDAHSRALKGLFIALNVS